MKSISSPALVVVVILLLAGCATPAVTEIKPTAEIYTPAATPLLVDAQKHDVVSFAKVLIQIPPGAPIGRVVLNGVPKSDIPFNGEGVREASVNYNLVAFDELRSAGYRVLGGESLLFSQDESAKARYTVGGTIHKIFFVVYGDFWWGIRNDAPVEASMNIEWQVFDNRARKICYTFTTRGYTKQTGTFNQAMQQAFKEAFRGLLAEQSFSNAVSLSKSPVENEQWENLVITTSTPAKLSLPADIEKALERVFTVKAGASHGTGFFISSNGYGLTAAHVVSGIDTVTVRLSTGIELEAKVVRSSPHADVALLKLGGTGFQAFALGATPAAGSDVFVIGTPLSEDLEKSVSKGVASGLKKVGDTWYIQTDAAVNPGNSGGPLLSNQGEVLGVISQKIHQTGIEGLGFAIPADTVRSALNLVFE
ncbi:MAG: trypsin-like peptidase domain-containing protein [Candidatus Didemnitutus sp.]|nr:trypsin-like peptidase domain-containing protein [Candidatus Didemnitutus sp.]